MPLDVYDHNKIKQLITSLVEDNHLYVVKSNVDGVYKLAYNEEGTAPTTTKNSDTKWNLNSLTES